MILFKIIKIRNHTGNTVEIKQLSPQTITGDENPEVIKLCNKFPNFLKTILQFSQLKNIYTEFKIIVSSLFKKD